ncbi:type III-A CRISPR-associated RAMP protein Csm4 [Flammeovirga sp. SJP92]|uniref:type III-A CRISPR-associated RAMP protein Csm4 n=1 Tax=Flammeovirga sp. SJP92 TaxID=1775430 RepID=UPI000787B2D6|nr:type III-A CRISPR-associated RAMP protein Csm4 [Flammeovirga sp. SJP92]KXX69436.1 hypothetical protein AVL50_19360 [Flammeovirga sp. SJP92]
MLRVYKLHFSTPLHLSDESEGYDKSQSLLHSDTLHAAIMSTYALLGKTEAIPHDGVPPFTISSLFPFAQAEENKETTYFLPKPFKPFNPNKLSEEEAKKIKKIEWIELSLFKQLIGEKGLAIEKDYIHKGKFLAKCKIGKVMDTEMSQRVVIRRDRTATGIDNVSQVFGGFSVPEKVAPDQETTPFYIEKLRFSKGSGLYFIYEGDEKNSSLFETALQLLGDEGIGTDRNVGMGKFSFEKVDLKSEKVWDHWDTMCQLKSDYSVTLSLYCPKDEEELSKALEGAKYNLIKRGGYITTEPFNALRKREVYMFAEGSVFRFTPNEVRGKSVNLQPDITKLEEYTNTTAHPIWRVGKAMLLPIVPEVR